MTGSGRTGRKATHRQQAVYTGAQRATAPLRPEPLSTQGQPPHMARWAGAKPRWGVSRRSLPSRAAAGGMDRKAEEEPIAELLATTTTQRGARPVDAQQAGGLRDTP